MPKNLFLIRWLATAQKQKRFPRSVAIDIQWLLDRGRKHGPAVTCASIWNTSGVPAAATWPLNPTCSGLTYASEPLKDLGWDNYVLDAKEWKSGVVPTPSQHNGSTSKKRR
ncbi:Uncharacterised protein [Klebsiella pneumoniae]|uniref:Uncharacterized protein n=1 Tax=Klebsiella pneumoniae TaxID=573 RepID=A0A377YQ48_KLEPN|nr:Uncharacterised protein [Klebsiella pneumoniae]